jgi:cutinase
VRAGSSLNRTSLGVLAAALALAVIPQAAQASATPATPTPSAARPAVTGCSDIEMIGARGSGEDPKGGASYATAPYDGLGPEVWTSWQRALGGVQYLLTVKETVVHYPALGVEYLFPHSGYVSRVRKWMAGVAVGKKVVVGRITADAAACPKQRYVLIGYSQGAQVMHEALSALLKKPTLLRRIAFAELLADPDRSPDQGTSSAGTATLKSSGIDTWLRHLSRQQAMPIPALVRLRVVSLCDKTDLVCDFSKWTLSHASKAKTVHVTHYNNTGLSKVWGTRAAAYAVRAQPSRSCAGVNDSLLPIALVCTAAATGNTARLVALLDAARRADKPLVAAMQRSWRYPEDQLQMVRALHAGGYGADTIDFPAFAYYTLTSTDAASLADGAKWLGFRAPEVIPDGYIASYRGLVLSFGYEVQLPGGPYQFLGVHHYAAQSSPGVLCQFPMLPRCT